MTSWQRYTLFGLLIVLSGCAVHDVKQQRDVTFAMPGSFSASGVMEPDQRWWDSVDDEGLQQVIDTVLDENRNLRAAWARLDQARALAVQSGAGRYVQMNATLDASRQRNETSGGGFTIPGVGQLPGVGGGVTRSNNYSFFLSPSYEIDLWKRIESTYRASEQDIVASRADIESTALGLTSSAATLWYGLVEQQAILALLEEQIDTSEKFLEVIEMRFGFNQATAVAVYQQRDQLAGIKTQIPVSRSILEQQENQLAVLAGKAATTFSVISGASFPVLPPLPDTGMPARLLERRPDVRAAYTRVLSADYRLGAAIAEQYPAIRLTTRTGFQADDPGILFDNWLWTLAANLTQPVLDGGRRRAEVERNRAIIEERLSVYENTMLTAIREVEDALVQETRLQEQLERIDEQLNHATLAFEQSQNRYLDGIGDYLSVLTSLVSVQALERQRISVEANRVTARIALYAALGGNWMSELQPPLLTNKQMSSGDES